MTEAIDVIVPTASLERWPASVSLPYNARTTSEDGLDVRWLPIVSAGEDFNFARSVNRGIAAARPDAWKVLLNDDCFMLPGWLRALDRAAQRHPDAGVIGSLLVFPGSGPLASRPIQHAGGFVPLTRWEMAKALVHFAVWLRAPFWTARQALAGDLRFPGHHTRLPFRRQRVDLITAAAMLISPACLEELGGFDEAYPLCFEDTDFCLRALQAGFRACLAVDSVGVHHESATTAHLAGRKEQSYRLFRSRWPVQRIREASARNRGGIVHPIRCRCGYKGPGA